jgi:DNA-binding IclR family transcriptional regulator
MPMSLAAEIRPKSQLRGRPSTRASKEAGNRTLVTGVELLLALSRMNDPATLTQIAQRTGMQITRAYRYLTALNQTGLLRHDPATGKYDLGPAAIELGMAAMGRLDAVRVASDVMRRLTEEVNLVSILSVWGSNGPTVIKWEQGRLDLSVRIREGLNLPLTISATGRVFLANLEPAETKKLLERDVRAWNAAAPARDKLDRKKLDAIRKEVLRHGLACTLGLRTRHMGALAAPVFEQGGRLAMVIALIGVVGSFDSSHGGIPAGALKAATQRLSRMLGAQV